MRAPPGSGPGRSGNPAPAPCRGKWLRAPQILRRGRQVELLRDVPEPAQPDPSQPEPLFEFSKQRFDLIAVSLRTLVGRRPRERADRYAHRLLAVHEEFPKGARRAALFLGTAAALPRRGAVDVAVRGRMGSAIAQRLARRTIIGVLLRRIAKLLSREPPPSLVAAINDRDVGLHAAREEPRQELAAGVGFVGTQAFRVQSQRLDLLEHPAGRQGFL